MLAHHMARWQLNSSPTDRPAFNKVDRLRENIYWTWTGLQPAAAVCSALWSIKLSFTIKKKLGVNSANSSICWTIEQSNNCDNYCTWHKLKFVRLKISKCIPMHLFNCMQKQLIIKCKIRTFTAQNFPTPSQYAIKYRHNFYFITHNDNTQKRTLNSSLSAEQDISQNFPNLAK